MSAEPTPPCGSQRVIRWMEGYEAETEWCRRTSGPCPFRGTDLAKGSQFPCAVKESPVEPTPVV